MRALLPALKLFALASLALFALPAFAQTAPATPPMHLFMAGGDLKAAIAKLKAARVGDQPLVKEPRLLSLPPYRAQLEYRPGTAPANVHETDAEMVYVLEGAGFVVTGGKLVNESRTDATNLAGVSIAGGTSQVIAVGDVFLIPENTPHQFTPSATNPLVLISVHMPRPAQPGWSWP